KFYIEAKASYQTLINDYPKGKYTPKALIHKAEILMEEKRYKEALKQLERVLVMYPFSLAVRDATFKIADSYFLNKDYVRAEELYREAVKKWPSFSKANPLVMFNIGETYFQSKNYKDARDIFFDFINLFPEDISIIDAILRIGDIYHLEGRDGDALIMYSEALSRYPSDEDVQTIKMKMANVGVERPNLTTVSSIFDYTPYVEPMNTYQDIIEKHPSDPLVHEAMLKKGNLLAAEKRYVEAVMTFKNLLSLYPEGKIADEGKKSIRDTFFKIIDTYHSQKGFYTLLLTYYKNFDPFLKDIKDPKILFEIGDSYLQMGLYNKAIESFNAVLTFDSKGVYKRDISIKMGEIYYLQAKYSDSESQMKRFIADYPDSAMTDDARVILGDTLYKQGRFNDAISEYTKYTRKKLKDFKTAKIYYNVANSYKNINNFQEAIKAYKQSKDILNLFKKEDNKDIIADIEFQILGSLYKMGRYAETIETADRLTVAYPDDRRTRWALYIAADCYKKMKNEDRSIALLTRLADIAKDELIGNIATAEIKDSGWKGRYKAEYE
ncbi:MAG: tetratricopeptide repeat protein, partial [Nitrospinota bacterium]